MSRGKGEAGRVGIRSWISVYRANTHPCCGELVVAPELRKSSPEHLG